MKHPIAKDNVMPMGWTSENVAADFNITRQMQDKYAERSHNRAERAREQGWTKDEIAPITTRWKDPKSGEVRSITVTEDDGIRAGTTFDGLSKVKAAFPQWGNGTTTGGNASQITDGAAAVLMMKRSKAQELGQKIIGKFVKSTTVGLEPRIMGIGPSFAIPKILERTGVSKEEVDLFEINEAFASMVTGRHSFIATC
jgi:acetyl-CoA acyltransferase 1